MMVLHTRAVGTSAGVVDDSGRVVDDAQLPAAA